MIPAELIETNLDFKANIVFFYKIQPLEVRENLYLFEYSQFGIQDKV